MLGKARQHLQGFLLRHGRIYPGKKGWTVAYRRWLTTVRFQHPAQQIVFQDYVDAVADAGGAAVLDRRHHFELRQVQMSGVLAAIGRPMGAEDIRDLQSGTRHESRA